MRPNILFAFADDWGRYASCYTPFHGEKSLSAFIETPNVDRIADEGVLFTNAFVPAPSCTPCRSSVLSGRYFWQTRLGAILQGAVFDKSIPTFPAILLENGYEVGFTYKVWGPGTPINDPYVQDGHRYDGAGTAFGRFSYVATDNLRAAGGQGQAAVEKAKEPLYDEVRGNVKQFLEAREEDKPFCYWWGPTNTHRKWQPGSGKELWGLDPDGLEGRLPDFFPDVPEVREDVADYLGECMAFDRGLGVVLDELEQAGELDTTLVVVSGDHGIPGFPRGKCNLYDIGNEVALMARLPGVITQGRVIEDLVNLMDLAPTFLEAGEAPVPDDIPARSLMPLLTSDEPADAADTAYREQVVTGRERHVAAARDGNVPYPHRAIRTREYLYIRNYHPERWPMGDPKGLDDLHAVPPPYHDLEHDTFVAYADCDAGPTKAWMVYHRGDEDQREIYEMGFGKRPREELFDISVDPFHLNNLADDPDHQKVKSDLSARLETVLRQQNDPRVCENPCRYELPPYTDPVDTTISPEDRWQRS